MTSSGRPEKPIRVSGGALAELAEELRRLRKQARLTYRHLADEAGFAPATLTAAASGGQLPSWPVVRAWAGACHGEEQAIRCLYERACTAAGCPAPGPDRTGEEPPDPAQAATPAQFVACMVRLRAWDGNPSLATLNQRSGRHLPPSTLSGVLRRESLPRLDFVLRYVRACNLPDGKVQAWEHAWKALKETQTVLPSSANGRNGQHPGDLNGLFRGLKRPAGGTQPPTSPLLALILMILVISLTATSIGVMAGRSGASGPTAPEPASAQAATITVQVPSPAYPVPVPGVLSHGDARALTSTIARTRTETRQGTTQSITTASGDEEFVGNLLGAGWGARTDGYLTAWEFELSGKIATPVLTLGGLPSGTAIGLLSGTARSLASCTTAQWYTASTIPLIPDLTVCIFRPSQPGLVSLLSVGQRSARQITLAVTAWRPTPQPASISTPGPLVWGLAAYEP
jgi:transcriptional regulator with XRE-family HTH domain